MLLQHRFGLLLRSNLQIVQGRLMTAATNLVRSSTAPSMACHHFRSNFEWSLWMVLLSRHFFLLSDGSQNCQSATMGSNWCLRSHVDLELFVTLSQTVSTIPY